MRVRSPRTGSVGARLASVLVTSEPLSATDISAADLVSAQSALDQLMAQAGVDGLVAALQNPGMLALIDQHVAAIRESLAAAGRGVDAVALARYARSVVAVACRHGRQLPAAADIDWREADWYLLRLVAVCALADAEGCL